MSKKNEVERFYKTYEIINDERETNLNRILIGLKFTMPSALRKVKATYSSKTTVLSGKYKPKQFEIEKDDFSRGI